MTNDFFRLEQKAKLQIIYVKTHKNFRLSSRSHSNIYFENYRARCIVLDNQVKSQKTNTTNTSDHLPPSITIPSVNSVSSKPATNAN